MVQTVESMDEGRLIAEKHEGIRPVLNKQSRRRWPAAEALALWARCTRSSSSPQRLRSLFCVLLCISGGCLKPSTLAPAAAPMPTALAAEPARISPMTSKQVGLSDCLLTQSFPKFAFQPSGERLGLGPAQE